SYFARKLCANCRGSPVTPPSRRPMQPRPDPRRRFVLPHLKHAAGRLGLGPYAPPGDGTGNVEIGGPDFCYAPGGDRRLPADGLKSVGSECDAGGFRSTISVAAPFVWRCLTRSPVAPVSTPLSSNRTCRFAASGSRTRRHAFTHDGPRPSWVRRTSRKCP